MKLWVYYLIVTACLLINFFDGYLILTDLRTSPLKFVCIYSVILMFWFVYSIAVLIRLKEWLDETQEYSLEISYERSRDNSTPELDP